MPTEPFPEDPALCLAPGTQVGPWRVLARQGHGSYGIVYRAVRIGQEDSGPVALKLARYPWDPRFEREAELLSRIHHPSVPRLLDRGLWRLPSRAQHPCLIMEWVDGAPFYDWAREQAPSSEQLHGRIAQLARALAATHAAHAVHRDVKGDNIRIRRSDGRAMLIDFGSGHYQGASRLTWNGLPPHTPAYRSPEAGLFELRSVGSPSAYFEATAADDLYSLGVTAWRLVIGAYPPELEPQKDEAGAWRIARADLRPLLEQNPWVDPLLREWLPRLLSLSAEERGTAVELAKALESGAAPRAVHASAAMAPRVAEVPAREVAPPRQAMSRAVAGRWWRRGQATAAVVLCWLCLWAVQSMHRRPEDVAEDEQGACSFSLPEQGTTAVGDSASPASVHPPSEQEAISQEPPPKPHPRQIRPNEKGHCPSRKQVALSGACWVELPSMTAEECAASGYAHYKGRCYAPTIAPAERPVPTSNPADAR